MAILPCTKCQGEGRRFESRYGGNDPDVRDAGQCDACEGSGNMLCEGRRCNEPATAFNDDGEALCQDCFTEWAMENFDA